MSSAAFNDAAEMEKLENKMVKMGLENGDSKATPHDVDGQKAEEQLSQERIEYTLPGKLSNTGRFANADRMPVYLNSYRLDVSSDKEKHKQVIYKYQLKFWGTSRPSTRPGAKIKPPKDLSIPPKHDVGRQQKRQLLRRLFKLLVEQRQDFFPQAPQELIYDCGVGLFSYKMLVSEGGQEIFDFNMRDVLDVLKDRPDLRSYLGRVSTIQATLSHTTGEVRMAHLSDALEFMKPDRMGLHFLDLLMDQKLEQNGRHVYFSNKQYDTESGTNVCNDDPRIVKSGMSKDIRLVGDSMEEAQPILQFDPKKSAFFPHIAVHEYLEQLLNEGRNRLSLEQLFQRGPTRRLAERQLRGLIVITTHLRRNTMFDVRGLSRGSARETSFKLGEGPDAQEVSVADYYTRHKGMELQRPDLPCVIEKARRPGCRMLTTNYYPMELVWIVQNQRIPREKQTPTLVQSMLRVCAIAPSQYPDAIEQQRAAAEINNKNEFLQRAGVRLADGPRLMRTQVELLYPPGINYGPKSRPVEPTAKGLLNWKLGGNAFAKPCQFPRVWCVVRFESLLSDDEMNMLGRTLCQAAQSRGIDMASMTRGDSWPTSDLVFLRNQFNIYKENHVGFVLFVAKDLPSDPTHHRMKLMEAETGIVTQHLSPMTVRKLIGDPRRQGRPSPMVADNTLMKLNEKLGGYNHNFHMSGEFAKRNHLQKDIINSEWLHPSRMFMGLELSHPAAQSRHDREANMRLGEPSVVGCAYTVGHPVKTVGTYWYQATRVTTILELQPYVEEALLNYREEMGGRWPRHLFVYRGGISEGEFGRAIEREKSAFENAFKSLLERYGTLETKPFKVPHLTIIVVQNASNFRLIPENVNPSLSDSQQNVQPGTCIDKHVMHPRLTEFLLVPHLALKGTAKPIRCTVIADTTQPERVSLEELENVTNILCYAHGIVTSPISSPSPLHSASDLAKRGNNNWKMDNYDGDDHMSIDGQSGSACGSGKYQKDFEEPTKHFWIRVSNALVPTLAHKTKFWA